jgi:hypothetical protein
MKLGAGVPLWYDGAKKPPAGEGRNDSLGSIATEWSGNPIATGYVKSGHKADITYPLFRCHILPLISQLRDTTTVAYRGLRCCIYETK